MRKNRYKSLERINENRKINNKNISTELMESDKINLLCFMSYFKCGEGYNDSYTVFRALPRRRYCTDYILSAYVNNISYHENIHYLYGNDTFYFSINSFRKKYNKEKRIIKGKERRVMDATNSLRNLSTINMIAFDIDFKDCTVLTEKYNNDEILEYILEKSNSILPCNAIVSSGNGCHIYYNLNNIVVNQNPERKKRMVAQYKALCKAIANEFAKFDIICDPQVVGDVCRILRVPYSYNTKTDNYKQSYIYYTNYVKPYDIKELFNEFNIDITNNNVKDLTNNNTEENNKDDIIDTTKEIDYSTIDYSKDFPVINNGYVTANTDESLYSRGSNKKNYSQTVSNRLDDIKKFVFLKRDYDGRRTIILSMLANMLYYANKEEKQYRGNKAFSYDVNKEIDTVNGYFSNPLNQKEIDTIKANYGKRKYKTTNVYWSEVLGLTDIDMTYSKEIINEDEYERRRKITTKINSKKYYDKNKETICNKKKEITASKKQAKIENENNLVKELINQGKNNSEIAKELGFSVKKVQRIKSRIK